MAIVQRLTNDGERRYDVRLRDLNGRVVNRTFRSVRAAEQYERERLHARDRGAMHDPKAGRITLEQWVGHWRHGRSASLRPNTIRIYDTNVDLHILPALGDAEINVIDRNAILAWVNQMSRRGFAPATVHQAFRVLRTVLGAAVIAGRIAVNPAVGRGIAPKLAKGELRILTPAEVGRLAGIIDPRYRALVLVAGFCGLRRGELAGLRWDRVDLEGRRIHVVEQLDRMREVAPLKSDASVRMVPIPKVVADALCEHQAMKYSKRTGYVFLSPLGKPLDVDAFRAGPWRQAVAAVGLPDLKLHGLRHTCASVMIASGADIKRIQNVMGHGSATLTLDLYGHLIPDALDALVERIDRITSESSLPVPLPGTEPR